MEGKLKDLQRMQTEMLDVVDAFCKEHSIPYSLYAGTLLGAVRHQGFIPWDDDLDICMSRENYNRFIELWQKNKPSGYILQNKETDSGFTQSFTKIRKENTTFLQYDWEIGRYHTGVFIDVFPIDRIPKRRIKRILFYWNVMKYQLFTREFIPAKSNAVVKFVSKTILILTPEKSRKAKREKLLSKITQHNENKLLKTVAIETMDSLKQTYSETMLDEYVLLPFEGRQFMCFKEWECCLVSKFGNYMKLPPEEERLWRHHPIILDFEKDYKELSE